MHDCGGEQILQLMTTGAARIL